MNYTIYNSKLQQQVENNFMFVFDHREFYEGGA